MRTSKVLLSILFLVAGTCGIVSGFVAGKSERRQHEDQIFVRGKWFNKNGKSSIPTEKQSTQPEIFQQCVDHFQPNGCDTTWNQVNPN